MLLQSSKASPRVRPAYAYSDKIPVQYNAPSGGSTSPPLLPEVDKPIDNDVQLTELEKLGAALEERMARLKHSHQLEEERARMQAEIEPLRWTK